MKPVKLLNISTNEVILKDTRVVNSKLTGYYVFVITCVIPLFFLPFSENDAFRLPKFVLWAVSFIVTIIFILIQKINVKEHLNIGCHSKIFILLGTYVSIWIISTFFSVNKMISIIGFPLYNGLVQLLISAASFLLITNYFQFKLSYMKYILIVYCTIAIYCIIQFYKIDPFTKYYGINVQNYIGQTFATIGNQNQVATCLSVVFVIVAFFFILGDENDKVKLLYFPVSLILFAGVITTNTRGGWLAITCTFIISLPYIIKHSIYLKRYIAICVGCSLILLTIDITSGGVTINRIMSIFLESQSVAAGELNGQLGSRRMEIWLNSIDLIRRYWLIGSGPDTFIFIYNNLEFKEQYLSGENILALSPHNESLRLLITTGIFSLIIYWTIVISIIKIGIKKIENNKYIIPFLLGLICYLIKGMLNCSVITDIIIFWVLLALIYSYEKPQNISKL